MDSRELAKLIDAYARPLQLYARQWCADPVDVVQNAFLSLLSEVNRPKNVKAWLYRVVRNLAVSESRSRNRRQQREQAIADGQESWFEPKLEDGLDSEIATEVLQGLSAEIREVVIARIWGQMTFEEIAKLTSITSSTAHRRYLDGIETLRRIMGVECQTDE